MPEIASNIEHWDRERLKPNPRNSRTHSQDQINAIASSIQRFGFPNAILVDEAGMIIAGHGRLLAAETLNLATVPVIVASGWTDAEKRAYMIADNQLALMAGWDAELLRDELEFLQSTDEIDIDVLGFPADDIQLILASGDAADDKADQIPGLPTNPQTKPNDIWQLGNHLLICADCRDPMTYHQTIADPINLVFTSPPYAEQREYDQSSGFRPIHPDDYVQWFEPLAKILHDRLADDGSFFLNIKPSAHGLDTDLYVFDLIIAHARQWRWHFATEFCWERNGVPKGVTQRFKNQFEPIYQLVKQRWKMRPEAVRHRSDNVPLAGGPGSGNTSWANAQGTDVSGTFGAARKRKQGTRQTMSEAQGTNAAPGTHVKQGLAFPGNRLNIERSNLRPNMAGTQGAPQYEDRLIGEGLAYPGNRLPTFTESHSAMGHAAAFPVGLPEFFMRAYTDEGDVVCDPFAGSGSTLIAAERARRKCVAVEISPAYCDVIVQRYIDYTGNEVVHARTKAKFHAKENVLMAG
jgi:DNA modification methylase